MLGESCEFGLGGTMRNHCNAPPIVGLDVALLAKPASLSLSCTLGGVDPLWCGYHLMCGPGGSMQGQTLNLEIRWLALFTRSRVTLLNYPG